MGLARITSSCSTATGFSSTYHARSNVETTFHMVKAKFGTKVRAKTETAQVNEI